MALLQPRILVVAYSRSGTTEAVASALARAAGADLELIRDLVVRRGVLGHVRAAYEARLSLMPPIGTALHDVRDYDIVALGSPTWGGALASPVRSYLAQHAQDLPEVAAFVTHIGAGAGCALAQLVALTGKRPLASMTLSRRCVRRGAAPLIGEFCESMLRAWESLPKNAAGPEGSRPAAAPNDSALEAAARH